MNSNIKNILNWAGGLLAIIGIFFVVLRIREYSMEIKFSHFGVKVWFLVICFALIYGFSNMMLALAWKDILLQLGASVLNRWAIKTYGISQLARYVPGNMFHFIGRQAMGMAGGVSGWILAKSSVWELVTIAVSGTLFSLLALPLIFPSLPMFLSLMLFAFVVLALSVAIRQIVSHAIGRAFSWHIVFLALSGSVFTGMIVFLFKESLKVGFPFSTCAGAYVLAWLIGLITPGAPAGLGIREIVLLFLLKNTIAEADLLIAIVIGRLITVLGDTGFFLFSTQIRESSKSTYQSAR